MKTDKNLYSDMNHNDFVELMWKAAHPEDDPSAEYAGLMDEAGRRIRLLEEQLITQSHILSNTN